MKRQRSPAIVRQFLYLDTEQIRSFVAQIQQGLPERTERVSVRRSSGGGKGSAKIPAIAELGISGSVLWESSSTETMSMHHFLFSIFEEAIRGSKKIVNLDSTISSTSVMSRLKGNSSFIFAKGSIQLSALERPFIEPVSELINWVIVQQRKLLKEGAPIQETGIVPFMDKMPDNLADKLKSLIPPQSFAMRLTAGDPPVSICGMLYPSNFQSEDAINVLLTPPYQASSDFVLSGITNTTPMIEAENVAVINVTPLAIYREY